MKNEEVQQERPIRPENGEISQEMGNVEKDKQEHKKGVETPVREQLTVANSTVVERELINCLKGMNYYLYNIVDQLNRINNYLTTQKMEDFK